VEGPLRLRRPKVGSKAESFPAPAKLSLHQSAPLKGRSGHHMSKKDIPTIHQSSTFNHCSCPASTFVTHCGALSLSAVGPYTRNYLPVQRLCRVYKSLVKLSQTLHIHTNLSPSTTYTVAGALGHTQRIVGTFHQPKPPRPWLHGSWLSSTSPGNQAPTRRCPVPIDILLPRSHTCISEALPVIG
jgi:hypothetical protein